MIFQIALEIETNFTEVFQTIFGLLDDGEGVTNNRGQTSSPKCTFPPKMSVEYHARLGWYKGGFILRTKENDLSTDFGEDGVSFLSTSIALLAPPRLFFTRTATERTDWCAYGHG